MLILAVAGIGAALYGGLPLLRTPWIAAGLALFALSGFSYRWVGQLQQRILGEARRPDATLAQLDPLLQRWSRIASFSVGLAWIALIVMVLKIPR
ncbi:DUF2269 domain-containing protein [Tahibacter caeni]|uniref:DUF2269 domain-containing protein n=1 Tax=Tahibacter caeni TaxID=1453545 RepID=UPI0021472EC5